MNLPLLLFLKRFPIPWLLFCCASLVYFVAFDAIAISVLFYAQFVCPVCGWKKIQKKYIQKGPGGGH